MRWEYSSTAMLKAAWRQRQGQKEQLLPLVMKYMMRWAVAPYHSKTYFRLEQRRYFANSWLKLYWSILKDLQSMFLSLTTRWWTSTLHTSFKKTSKSMDTRKPTPWFSFTYLTAYMARSSEKSMYGPQIQMCLFSWLTLHLGTELKFCTGMGAKHREIDVLSCVLVIGQHKAKGLIGLHYSSGA